MTDTTQPRHSNAGFFSSASRLVLVRGPAVDVTGVRGYPIDMRVKAQSPQWPLQGMSSPADEYVAVAQFGLGCYERYLAGEGEVWLAAAKQVGEFLLDSQKSDGSWLNLAPFLHTYPLRPPWACGMAHGQAASLLVRLHLETGDDRYAQAARKGLEPLVRPTAQGGVCANLDGAPWPEEYPTEPASFVLNGAIFAWWGMRDVGVGLGDDDASRWFETGVDDLAANLHRFDTGSWSLYSLYPHPVAPIASSFYHALHISQLEVMHELSPRPELQATARRWATYFESASLRRLALARKVLFRLVVPRNRLLGSRLPWTRG